MGTTEKVARYIVDFDYDVIPPKGLEQAKASIVDSIGVALLGVKDPGGNVLTNFIRNTGGQPQARIWGNGTRTSLPNAVLANAFFTHLLDFDDGGGFGHHGAVMVPPALALGEKYKLSGRQILEAYAVAYEVGNKLLRSLGEIGSVGGFHGTTLLGSICAAVESAKLLALDINQTRMALGIAASVSSGLIQSFGSHAKPFQVGCAAQNGMTAAILACQGLTGDPNIFEESLGFFYVYGQEQANIKHLTEHIGKPLIIAEQDMHFKQWACCGGNYEALSALFDLMQESNIQVDQIKDITVATSWKPPGPVNRPCPNNAMEARFSLPYNVATALYDGVIDLSSFSDENFRRPAVHNLMEKVKIIWHPDCEGKPRRLLSESRFVVIDITFRDGRKLSKMQPASTRKQLKVDEVYLKYVDNARMAGISENNINRAIALVKSFEHCEDVTELIDLVCPS